MDDQTGRGGAGDKSSEPVQPPEQPAASHGPEQNVPEQAVAPFPTAEYGQAPDGASQLGQPQDGVPQYGQPQYGQPQYGTPQYGQPQYGQPQYGQAPHGAGPAGYPPAGYVQPGGPVVARSGALGLIISFFVPGVGSMINGSVGRGIVILVGYAISWMFSFVLIGIPFLIGFWIWGLVDGYQSAQRWNAAHGIIS